MRLTRPPIISPPAVAVMGTMLTAGLACSHEDSSPIVHPVLDRVANMVAVARRAPENETKDSLLVSTRRRLLNASPIWRVGSDMGPPEHRFENIVAAATSPAGDSILVLDAVFSNIRTYSLATGHASNTGLNVGGARTLHIAADGSLLLGLLDAVREIAIHGGQRTREWAHLPPVLGLCTVAGDLFVRTASPRVNGVLLRLSEGAVEWAPLGRGYVSDDAYAAAQFSAGRIACVEDVTRVLVAYDNLPFVQAYDTDGTLVWTAHIEDFVTGRVEQRLENGRPAFRRQSTEARDVTQSIVSVPGGMVLVQIARIPTINPQFKAPVMMERLDSYLLSVSTGEGIYVGIVSPSGELQDNTRRACICRA
jgi:hypothetical protein